MPSGVQQAVQATLSNSSSTLHTLDQSWTIWLSEKCTEEWQTLPRCQSACAGVAGATIAGFHV